MKLREILEGSLNENSIYNEELDNFFNLYYDMISKLETMQNIKGITPQQKQSLYKYAQQFHRMVKELEATLESK